MERSKDIKRDRGSNSGRDKARERGRIDGWI
jgi:hypothetical protein